MIVKNITGSFVYMNPNLLLPYKNKEYIRVIPILNSFVDLANQVPICAYGLWTLENPYNIELFYYPLGKLE